MDTVNENIDKEVRQGESQKAELRKAIMKTGVDGMDENDRREMDMDIQLFGQGINAAATDHHSVSSLLSAMETACSNIEQEISQVDQDATTVLSGLNATVGELSDLRYGKLQGPAGSSGEEMVKDAIDGLEHLEQACYRKISQ